MANLSRVADLLKEAVSVLSTNVPSTSQPAPVPEASTSTSLRNIFAPYRRARGGFRPNSHVINARKPMWSHKFFCLASPYQECVPDKAEKKVLMDAGLGEKKITLLKNNDSGYLREILWEKFPKLKDGGGFELLRSSTRISLEKISMPASGYHTNFLADESGLGGAICYVRPIQATLSLEPLMDLEPTDDCIKELCKGCGETIPVLNLREHVALCYAGSDEEVPVLKKTKKDRPICNFACANKRMPNMSGNL